MLAQKLLDTGLAAARLHGLGGEIVLAAWDSPQPAAATRITALIGGSAAPRPYTTLSLPTARGGTRTIAALRWPAADRAGKVLLFVDEADRAVAEVRPEPGEPAAAGSAIDFDPAALLAGLAMPSRVRAAGLVLEFCSATFRLAGDAAFAANGRRLVLEMFPRPAPLVLRADLTRQTVLAEGALAAGFGEPTHALVIGRGWVRRNPFPPGLGTGLSGKGDAVPVHLVMDRALSEADALVLFAGPAGLACRQLKAAAGRRPSLLEWLESSRTIGVETRDYIARSLAAVVKTDPQAAVREMQLCLPLSCRHALAVARPVGGAIELAVGHGTGGLFLAGWLLDPHGLIEAITAVSPLGNRRLIEAPLHRFPRTDLQKRQQPDTPPAGSTSMTPTGFITFAPGEIDPIPTYQQRFELLLKSGARIELVAPPQPTRLAEARAAVLGSIPPPYLTPQALETCIAPAAAGLHARYMAERGATEIVPFGIAPARPRVSVIVPLYRNLDFVRFQMAAFAVDPDFRSAELIFVLDSPEQRLELEHLLRGLYGVYELPLRLVIMPANYGYSAANNAGAATARGEHLLLLNSDVIPDGPGWLSRLADALDAYPAAGAVGAKLLFEDDSLQHAGLYFDRDSRGQWINQHFYKGLPRYFPPAGRQRPVPALSGACLMVRREVFQAAGGLTEDYIIGDYEDSDFCLKIRRAGHDLLYVPDAELYHLERQSILQHPGYTRSVAAEYNRWLHTGRWDETMQQVMRRPMQLAVVPARPRGPARAPRARQPARRRKTGQAAS